MANSLAKIVELIKKTGDNCVVLDSAGNPAYAVISFDDYRSLVLGKAQIKGLTEEQLLEKINFDIATWKESAQEESLDDWEAISSSIEDVKIPDISPFLDRKSLNIDKKEQIADKPEEKYYFEPID
ncbi:hypothetical protein HYZ76_02620 [Candidatus Falkowbacteria bacterium]|nr:hypothetical protein [Candidatus Falkowbacteria bacterium]